MKNEVIAEKLISLRGEISRIEVAEAIGISVSALAMYEQGNRIPRDEIKIKLADFYGVPIQDIFLTTKYTLREYFKYRWNATSEKVRKTNDK